MACKLKIENVHKSFGDFLALEETSLEVPEGEFLTLLGPSGSGKTTLLMMVSGLLSPDGGRIWIDGVDSTHLPAFHRDIGMVFQNYALFPHMSIFDNIAFPLRMRGRPAAEVRKEVERVLEIVQLGHVANRFPRQLSGGQQQRIALARCIVYSPSIILMDEPLGALDKKLRDQLQIEIKQLHRKLNTTILYVTHDQQETLTMSDRVCLMSHGRVEQLGSPAELYFQPHSAFAADFLGESNLLPVEVAERSGDTIRLTSPALGGASMLARARPGVDSPRAVMIRPERIVLDPREDQVDNIMEGTISERLFVGSVSKTFVILPDGGTLFVTALTTGSTEHFEPGRTVRIGWSRDSAVLLPDMLKEKAA